MDGGASQHGPLLEALRTDLARRLDAELARAEEEHPAANAPGGTPLPASASGDVRRAAEANAILRGALAAAEAVVVHDGVTVAPLAADALATARAAGAGRPECSRILRRLEDDLRAGRLTDAATQLMRLRESGIGLPPLA